MENIKQKKRIKISEAENKLEKTLNKLESGFKKFGIDISKPEAYETRKNIYKLLEKELRCHYIISDC